MNGLNSKYWRLYQEPKNLIDGHLIHACQMGSEEISWYDIFDLNEYEEEIEKVRTEIAQKRKLVVAGIEDIDLNFWFKLKHRCLLKSQGCVICDGIQLNWVDEDKLPRSNIQEYHFCDKAS